MASLLPDICAKVGTITIKPSETDLVKLAEKGNYSPAPFLDKTMGRLGKIFKKIKTNSGLIASSLRDHQALKSILLSL